MQHTVAYPTAEKTHLFLHQIIWPDITGHGIHGNLLLIYFWRADHQPNVKAYI